jgi:hypothetical protein
MSDQMRAGDVRLHTRASLFEQASRISFLRAHLMAQHEEKCAAFGQSSRRAVFSIA